MLGQRVLSFIGGAQFSFKSTSTVHATSKWRVEIKVEKLSKTRFVFHIFFRFGLIENIYSLTILHVQISDALELYKELDKEKKKFTLVPCWNKLKGEDKWKAKREELAEQEKLAANKKQKVNIDSTPRTVEATNNEDVLETAAPKSEARKRPQGVKKAKEAIKRGGGEACMEALDKMWAKNEAFDLEREKKKEERFLISLELEKKRMDVEEKRAESNLIKEEKEIMAMDMSSLTHDQQQYYVIMQRKIIARRLTN
jgi:hypothetical protein